MSFSNATQMLPSAYGGWWGQESQQTDLSRMGSMGGMSSFYGFQQPSPYQASQPDYGLRAGFYYPSNSFYSNEGFVNAPPRSESTSPTYYGYPARLGNIGSGMNGYNSVPAASQQISGASSTATSLYNFLDQLPFTTMGNSFYSGSNGSGSTTMDARLGTGDLFTSRTSLRLLRRQVSFTNVPGNDEEENSKIAGAIQNRSPNRLNYWEQQKADQRQQRKLRRMLRRQQQQQQQGIGQQQQDTQSSNTPALRQHYNSYSYDSKTGVHTMPQNVVSGGGGSFAGGRGYLASNGGMPQYYTINGNSYFQQRQQPVGGPPLNVSTQSSFMMYRPQQQQQPYMQSDQQQRLSCMPLMRNF